MSKSKALDKLSKARMRLLLHQPFFGIIALRMRFVEDKACPSMGTDGRTFFFNPRFIEHLSLTQLITAVAHECMHVVFLHALRRHDRNPILWNAAGDYAINPILIEANMEPVVVDKKDFKFEWLHERKYEGMTADEIYNKLEKEARTTIMSCNGLKDHPSKDKKRGRSGKQKSEGGNQDQDSGFGDGDIVSPEEAEVAAKVLVAEAYAAAKHAGTMPAGLSRIVDEWLHPKIAWQDKLRRFVEQVARNDYSWARPNTRFLQRGFYIPSLYNLELGEVIVAIDTSGSISEKGLKMALAELSEILEAANPTTAYVVYVDADVQNVEEYTKDDLPLRSARPSGGGGTDFKPPFDWAEKEQIEPVCLVYITDLWCSSYPDPPNYPVIWVTEETPNASRIPPFGEVIVME